MSVSVALELDPDSLPAGATASYPEFDGDAFSAVLPVSAQEDLSPAQALEQIAPVLRAMGFQRSLSELQVPQEAFRLQPPDLRALAGEVRNEAALRPLFVASPGPDLEDLRRELERPSLQYAFPQLVDGVPIDGAGAFAFRREGESLSIVHGTLFNSYEVTNHPADPRAALDAARRLLQEMWTGGGPLETLDEPELVMLPQGAEWIGGREVPILRHAWRLLLRNPRTLESWMAWIDAETGALLEARPQQDGGVEAQGERWRRDPGLCEQGEGPCTEVVSFEVDEAVDGELVLALDGVFEQFDNRAVKGGGEVAIQGPEADFTEGTIGEEDQAVCKSGNNAAFRQVHAYAHLYGFRKLLQKAGSLPEFPAKPITVWLDDPEVAGSWAGYDAWPPAGALLRFSEGKGFADAQCPHAVGSQFRLNGSQDAGTLAHEMAHLSVKRMQERRPKGWCNPPAGAKAACPQPEGRGLFHDFADAIANAYTSTNCFAGWSDKNADGVDANLYCQDPAKTSERGRFPRLAHVADVFDPDDPGDHFPEHHSGENVSDYADGQIAAAALWRVRQGMRSKAPLEGTLEYWVRLNRALWSFGFVKPVCSKMAGENKVAQTCEVDLYRYLQDLERRLVEQWAAAPKGGATGRHTANKVLSGFARAGIFLSLHQCLDRFPKQSLSCFVAGKPAGDAVIDVDDRDPADDPVVDGVTHVEVDYLERGGPPPLFRVWTGPRFRLQEVLTPSTEPPYLCHAKFQVEAASRDDFQENLWTSAVLSAPDCQGQVELPAESWSALQGSPGSAVPIYYRVRTWDASMKNERISTSPGAGAFNLPPPFVVVNDSGRP